MNPRPLSTNPLVFRALPTGTRVGSTVMAVLLTLSLALDFDGWRVAIFATGLVVMASLNRATRSATDGQVSQRRWSMTFLAVLTLQTAVIAATGGVQSAILPAYIGPVLMSVIIFGRPAFILSVGSVTAAMLVLGAVHIFSTLDPLAAPSVLARAETGWTTLLGALVVWVMSLGGARFSLLVADLIEAQRRSMIESQAAVADAYDERHRDLLAISGALAHEMKNPLTAVQSLSSLMRRRAEDNTRAAEELDVLLNEVRRMRATIDEFLDFSRPIGTLAVAPDQLDRLAEDVRAAHAALAEERGITVEVHATPTPVVCDGRKIKQILANLLHNAADASPPGAKVTVRVEVLGSQAVVTIEDEGEGISGDIADQLFRPGATTKGHGSGLGLVISRALAEQHEGTLTLHNRAAGGCAATLRLPTTPEPTVA